jgi:hypothetical protein
MKGVIGLGKKYAVEGILLAILAALYASRRTHRNTFVHTTAGRATVAAAVLAIAYIRGPVAGVAVGVIAFLMMNKVYEGFEGMDAEEGAEGEEAAADAGEEETGADADAECESGACDKKDDIAELFTAPEKKAEGFMTMPKTLKGCPWAKRA